MNNPEILDSVLVVLFGTAMPAYVVAEMLWMIGVWQLLIKSGVKGWWALIPGAREYQLSRCAGREAEGRVYFLSTLIIRIIDTFGILLLAPAMRRGMGTETADIIQGVIVVALGLVSVVYEIRVVLGLIDVYGVRKRWLWLWIIPLGKAIPALVWGFNPKYQPSWKVEDIRKELQKLAHQGSATVMDEGLTVNLEERSVMEFFHKKTLLRDIHLAIPQGHMVLLLGGSGAGKTTFLNAVNGYEKARAQVMLNGTDIYRQYRKMQYEIGFVPQTETVRYKDTVMNTLLDTAKLRLPSEVPASERRKRVEDVMELFGLSHARSHLIEKLSGGMKKRLSISMEFISNPSLFILDEPDSGLDGVMARGLFRQLRSIADTGKIVIVITHTPDRVVDLFDDVIVLARDSARTGRLGFYGSIDEARRFFGQERMEQIVKCINSKSEGGDGRADEFVMKYAQTQRLGGAV